MRQDGVNDEFSDGEDSDDEFLAAAALAAGLFNHPPEPEVVPAPVFEAPPNVAEPPSAVPKSLNADEDSDAEDDVEDDIIETLGLG